MPELIVEFHNLGSAVVSKGDIVIAKKIASRNSNVRFFIDVLNWEGSPFEYDIYSKAGEIQEVVIYGNQKE